ncbi:MAG: hypothetical protein HC866_12475 [Leptolyngbyaceae cyanobacterium RU_5_1]|nr:hypothetical protein [Leptolyngbyaceae cyanobacterium RU_5_1]
MTQCLFSRKSLSLITVAALSSAPVGLNQIAASSSSTFPLSHPAQSSATADIGATPATVLAQTSRIRRVKFAPGKYSTTLEDAVVRGTRDIYLLGASKGQTISVKIASLENNAVFEVTAPPNKAGQRRTLKQEAVNWTSVLPVSGDYQIIVGGTRGNTSYKLQVAIR